MKGLTRLATGVAAGVAVDRLAPQPAGDDAQQAPSRSTFRRGDEMLGDMARRVQVPAQAPNPMANGVRSQISDRVDFANRTASILKNPQRAVDNLDHAVETLKADAEVLHGAVLVATGEPLTLRDGARIAAAAADSAGNKIIAAAKGAFAAATTSEASLEDLTRSVSDRAIYEAESAVSGMAASQLAAAVVGSFPHPGAKVLAQGIRLTGAAAAGSKLSQASRETGEAGGPISKELAAIAREKSQGSGSVE